MDPPCDRRAFKASSGLKAFVSRPSSVRRVARVFTVRHNWALTGPFYWSAESTAAKMVASFCGVSMSAAKRTKRVRRQMARKKFKDVQPWPFFLECTRLPATVTWHRCGECERTSFDVHTKREPRLRAPPATPSLRVLPRLHDTTAT